MVRVVMQQVPFDDIVAVVLFDSGQIEHASYARSLLQHVAPQASVGVVRVREAALIPSAVLAPLKREKVLSRRILSKRK